MLLAEVCGCSSGVAPGTAPAAPARSSSGPGKSGYTAVVTTALRFVDVTQKSGIEFTYRDGQEAGLFTQLETLGGGSAACDFDGDGAVDIIVAGGGTFVEKNQIAGLPPGFFRNDGTGQFTDVGQAAGLIRAVHYSHGVAAGDYDNDGFTDLVITGYPGLAMYKNQGDGTFLPVDLAELEIEDRLWSSSAAWGDLDGDGNLDLYVVHYVDWSFENNPLCRAAATGQRDLCGPKSFHALPDALYANDGAGRFREVSREAGLRPDGKGLGVVIADLDLDGLVDIFVGNDTTPNFLYHNLGELKLEEVGQLSGANVNDRGNPDGSMGVEIIDYNLDGRPDLWVTDFEDEYPALYRNLGHGLFRHVSRVAGVAALGGMYVGWGTVAADFDHDGDEDLFITNGHAFRYSKRAPLKQPSLLFENLGGERFGNATAAAGPALAVEHLGRGLASADFDGDGDIDLFLTPINEPLCILANESRGGGHWLALHLIGTQSNRDAIGAMVRLETVQGVQVRQVKGGGSYASTSDRTVHFGWREGASARVEIRWPAGQVQILDDVPADRRVRVVEPR
jgi:hypothetical protein